MSFSHRSKNTMLLACATLILLVVLSACQQSPSLTDVPAFTLTPDIKILPDATLDPQIIANSTAIPCTETTGTRIERTISIDSPEKIINLKIYLPACYSEDAQTKYPVLFMLHGLMNDNEQWIRLGLFDSMDEMIANDQISPFIIVLPNEARTNIEGNESDYGDIIINDVIPYMDKNFNICPEKACRAIGGLSRGGNWAVRIGFSAPSMFTAIGAHSTPLFYSETLHIWQIVKDMQSVSDLPFVYIDVGSKDPDVMDVYAFHETLDSYDIPHQYIEFIGYHDENYWSAHVKDYLTWYSSQFYPQ